MTTTKRKPTTDVSKSRAIKQVTRLQLAADSAGRCEFAGCNKLLFQHHLTTKRGFFGQHAHIIAFSLDGPRGGSDQRPADPHHVSNLMLLCSACHKLVDDNPSTYPVNVLISYKQAHERRIEHVTGLGPEMRTEIVQLKANIAGQPVGIPVHQVVDAIDPRYPIDLRGHVIDLTELHSEDDAFYEIADRELRQRLAAVFNPGLAHSDARHFSVFALAPIPLLMSFGSALGNKVTADLYQRHRDTEDWCWKQNGEPAHYEIQELQSVAPTKAALILSLSGKVPLERLPSDVLDGATVFELTLADQTPHRSFLQQRDDLERFGVAYRDVLTRIQASCDVRELHVFPAVPAPVAVTCGRELLPKVDPALLVYDFDQHNGFVPRLKVCAYDPERVSQ